MSLHREKKNSDIRNCIQRAIYTWKEAFKKVYCIFYLFWKSFPLAQKSSQCSFPSSLLHWGIWWERFQQCPKVADLWEMTGHKFHFYYDLFEPASIPVMEIHLNQRPFAEPVGNYTGHLWARRHWDRPYSAWLMRTSDKQFWISRFMGYFFTTLKCSMWFFF